LIVNNFMNRTLAISPDGRWLANSATTNTIQLFNLTQPGSEYQLLEGHNGWIVALSFTPDGRTLYSASRDNTIIEWDLINGSHSTFITLTSTVPNCMEISSTGAFLLCGTQDGRLIMWDTNTKTQSTIYSGNAAITSISLNANSSRIAFGDQNGILRVADAQTRSILQTVSAHSAQIKDLDYSPDGQQIATASYDRTVKIWDGNNLTTNQPIEVKSHNAFVMSLAFSPDGRYLVTSSNYENTLRNETLYFWHTHNQQMAQQICNLVSRNMTQREWENNVSPDIPYENTCP
jgi:WD40 repeat protein